jgi:hypothetical protein
LIEKAIKILNNKNVFLIVFVLLLAIAFETFQQLFYIKRFQLSQNIDFFELLKNQFYKWIIWFFIGITLLFFIKRDLKKEPDYKLFFKYFLIILLLVLINIFIISCFQIIIFDEKFSISTFFSEYFSFYLFQKAPIYLLGYIAITIILFLNYNKNLLQIEVQELIDIKENSDKIYNELRAATSDKSKVLTIKVGNKRKIISVETITWLEADDYCVIVHTNNNPSYTMRSSLKALQGKLGDNFLRVHRKGIVNMNMVKELNHNSNPKLILTNDDEILVSKSNIKLVNDFLKS